jgi:sulfonate transport system ATP-binding protein
MSNLLPGLNTSAHEQVQPACVDVASVSKSFGSHDAEVVVLNDISLTINPGETLALLGPSGCGKSTLLRLIAGLDTPTSGAVLIDDQRVTGIEPRCSVVFQEPRLLPWRSVSANVRLGSRGGSAESEVGYWLDLVGLNGFENHLPKEISGGMAQRTALARALIGHPGVLLLDEPFAALDALTRMKMQDLLADVVEALGTTVLLVTHDVDEALYLADRVVVLGQRGEAITDIVNVDLGHPRDRSDTRLGPMRTQLLRRFGIHI